MRRYAMVQWYPKDCMPASEAYGSYRGRPVRNDTKSGRATPLTVCMQNWGVMALFSPIQRVIEESIIKRNGRA